MPSVFRLLFVISKKSVRSTEWVARLALFTTFALCRQAAFSQAIKDGDNLVPNPGFERFAAPPVGWSYKGAFFGQVVKYWFSASTASPDVYGPGVKVPQDWAEKGFGKQKPHGGRSMAGLTLYGCTNGKPHCREYVEIQLAEPLVSGQTYLVELWVTSLPRALQINNIGVYFSEKRIERLADEQILASPQFSAKTVVRTAEGKWVKLGGQFTAENEAEYLLLGNFFEDKDTRTEATDPEGFNYAYYYFDDVLVKKIPPFIPVPVKPDDLTRQPLETGKAIQLKNLYFEFDKHELMPRSYVELDKLLRILRENPTLHIQITGHTDNIGGTDYNKWLSRKRAQAVWQFLVNNGIAAGRLKYLGMGKARPIASNQTEAGRFQNRRVEFVVLKR